MKKYRTFKNIFTEDIMYAKLTPEMKTIEGETFMEVYKTTTLDKPFFMRQDAFKEVKQK